jgi:hypothetical protein
MESGELPLQCLVTRNEASNMKLKPQLRKLRCSDVPTAGSFANGFAIMSQTLPPQSRRLTQR